MGPEVDSNTQSNILIDKIVQILCDVYPGILLATFWELLLGISSDGSSGIYFVNPGFRLALSDACWSGQPRDLPYSHEY